jgi:hypothetical protein
MDKTEKEIATRQMRVLRGAKRIDWMMKCSGAINDLTAYRAGRYVRTDFHSEGTHLYVVKAERVLNGYTQEIIKSVFEDVGQATLVAGAIHAYFKSVGIKVSVTTKKHPDDEKDNTWIVIWEG